MSDFYLRSGETPDDRKRRLAAIPKRKCAKCGIEKWLRHFAKDKSCTDGLARTCKSCVRTGGKRSAQTSPEKLEKMGARMERRFEEIIP